MIHVVKGNSKLGSEIPHIDLPPVITCPRGVPCKEKCYALKSYRQYPNVRKNLDENWDAYKASPAQYFADIQEYCARQKPKYFRYHVSGDIQGARYFAGMVDTARLYPKTRFMTYTKTRYWSMPTPGNLVILRSLWLGEEPSSLAPCFRVFGKEEEIPRGWKACKGSCGTCKTCWHAGMGDKIAVRMH